MNRLRSVAAILCAGAAFLAAANDAQAAPPLTVIHAFTGAPGDGTFPSAGLMLAADGLFYGTTQSGGAFDRGTIFKMTPDGAVTVVHSFAGGADGDFPAAALIQDSDGNFYGTTYFGGGVDLGAVFRMTPDGVVTVIHPFLTLADGAYPRAALLQASDGNLYGTTERGGDSDRGTLFGLTLAGQIIFQHSFSAAEGEFPFAPVIQARNGVLYGTLSGTTGIRSGAIFRLAGTTLSIVHHFNGGNTDGATPHSALIEAIDGNFYGTTERGGIADGGTVFRMTPAGAVTLVTAFGAISSPIFPHATLLQTSDGSLYGSTTVGGTSSARITGALFKITPAGTLRFLHSFGRVDGVTPAGQLIEFAGKLYGIAITGGPFQRGVVFRLENDLDGAPTGDFGGDRHADLSVFRPSDGRWFILDSASGARASRSWGVDGDVPVPGDYDGDGRTELAVYRPSSGHWFILKSSTGYASFDTVLWGADGDTPIPADYDGDGKTDIAVYRPSTGQWFILDSSTGFGEFTQFTKWGEPGDIPAPGDFDGDGLIDIAVFRPSTGAWFFFPSTRAAPPAISVGGPGDIPVASDFDNDGKTDAAIYRPSTGVWEILLSRTQTLVSYAWGTPGDVPVPSDYDGDGKTDVAVYRPTTGQWFILKSSINSTGYDAFQWGAPGDVPILRR